MGFGPQPDASQRDDGAATVIGQGVFHAQRHLGIHRTHEQPGVLQTSQRRREHHGRHPIESATQSTEALRCITQGFDDHHRPFARHDIQQLTARALRGKHVPRRSERTSSTLPCVIAPLSSHHPRVYDTSHHTNQVDGCDAPTRHPSIPGSTNRSAVHETMGHPRRPRGRMDRTS